MKITFRLYNLSVTQTFYLKTDLKCAQAHSSEESTTNMVGRYSRE